MRHTLRDKPSVSRNNIPYILLTVALLLLAFIPFVMRGLSEDGVLYSGFAFNLAHGVNSLWAPFLTPVHWPEFHEHPPLAFYIHSLFITYLGDGAFVDKLYFFSTAVASLSLVLLFWRKYNRNISSCFLWVPALYWLLIVENVLEPYRGNIDATLIVFTTLAAFLIFNACAQERGRSLNFLAGALSIIAAFFTNGCQAFFLLIVPMIYHVTIQKGSLWSGVKQSLLLACLIFTGIFVFLYANKPASEHIRLYLFDKVFHRSLMADDACFLIGRFKIFWVIFKNIFPALLVSAICFVVYSKRFEQPLWSVVKKYLNNRRAYFFFLVALGASLPVIVSPHQTSRYIVASFPLWTLCFSELLTPLFVSYTHQLDYNSQSHKLYRYLSIFFLGFVIAFGYFCSNKIIFGRPIVEDIALLQKVIPKKTEISIDTAAIDDDWSYLLRLSLYRYMQIISYGTLDKPYFIQGKQVMTHPEGYEHVPILFQTFALFKRVPQQQI